MPAARSELIVAGCLVERYRDEIRKNIPEVDAVVGTGELEAILERGRSGAPASGAESAFNSSSILYQRHRSAPAGASRPEGDLREPQGRFSREHWDGATAELPEYLYSDKTPRILTTPQVFGLHQDRGRLRSSLQLLHHSQLRGKFRSRRLESIVAEAEKLDRAGCSRDHADRPGHDLLRRRPRTEGRPGAAARSAGRLPGLKWLRFLYAYPNKITTRLLETIARHDNICEVPRCAVCSMLRRGAEADEARRDGRRFPAAIEKARATVPGIVMRTSFIVGFPGETDEDFQHFATSLRRRRSTGWAFSGTRTKRARRPLNWTELKVPERTIEARRRSTDEAATDD